MSLSPMLPYNRGESWDMEATERKMKGFACVDDMAQWHKELIQPLRATGLLASAKRFLMPGVMYSSTFSGYDSPREALRVLFALLRDVHPGETALQMKCLHSCDVGKLQQKVLIGQSQCMDGGSSCVFANIDHRLPNWAAAWIACKGCKAW